MNADATTGFTKQHDLMLAGNVSTGKSLQQACTCTACWHHPGDRVCCMSCIALVSESFAHGFNKGYQPVSQDQSFNCTTFQARLYMIQTKPASQPDWDKSCLCLAVVSQKHPHVVVVFRSELHHCHCAVHSVGTKLHSAEPL